MKKMKIEFSKLIMGALVLSYFVGLGYGMIMIARLLKADPSYVYMALGSLFAYIGGPVSVGIGFYSNKSKAENVVKIKNSLGPIVENIVEQKLNRDEDNLEGVG